MALAGILGVLGPLLAAGASIASTVAAGKEGKKVDQANAEAAQRRAQVGQALNNQGKPQFGSGGSSALRNLGVGSGADSFGNPTGSTPPGALSMAGPNPLAGSGGLDALASRINSMRPSSTPASPLSSSLFG